MAWWEGGERVKRAVCRSGYLVAVGDGKAEDWEDAGKKRLVRDGGRYLSGTLNFRRPRRGDSGYLQCLP